MFTFSLRIVHLFVLGLFQILMAAGDTYRAAASDQLEIWAERTGSEIVVAEGEKAKASTGWKEYQCDSFPNM